MGIKISHVLGDEKTVTKDYGDGAELVVTYRPGRISLPVNWGRYRLEEKIGRGGVVRESGCHGVLSCSEV